MTESDANIAHSDAYSRHSRAEGENITSDCPKSPDEAEGRSDEEIIDKT